MELAYASSEVEENMRLDFMQESPEFRSRHKNNHKNYRKKNDAEMSWLIALTVQWYFWVDQFVFWFLYNVGIKAFAPLYFMAWISPLLGLMITYFHYAIYNQGGCENGRQDDWEAAIFFHISSLISLFMNRRNFLDFLKVDKYRRDLKKAEQEAMEAEELEEEIDEEELLM